MGLLGPGSVSRQSAMAGSGGRTQAAPSAGGGWRLFEIMQLRKPLFLKEEFVEYMY